MFGDGNASTVAAKVSGCDGRVERFDDFITKVSRVGNGNLAALSPKVTI
jgi:hypothetical protein